MQSALCPFQQPRAGLTVRLMTMTTAATATSLTDQSGGYVARHMNTTRQVGTVCMPIQEQYVSMSPANKSQCRFIRTNVGFSPPNHTYRPLTHACRLVFMISCVIHFFPVVKVYIWGPRNSEKIGALLSAEGALLNLLVPLTAVWGPGTLASNF